MRGKLCEICFYCLTLYIYLHIHIEYTLIRRKPWVLTTRESFHFLTLDIFFNFNLMHFIAALGQIKKKATNGLSQKHTSCLYYLII
jgi:hypothetical protein